MAQTARGDNVTLDVDAIRRRVKLIRSEARPAEPGTLWGEVDQLCEDVERLLDGIEQQAASEPVSAELRWIVNRGHGYVDAADLAELFDSYPDDAFPGSGIANGLRKSALRVVERSIIEGGS